MQCLAMGYNCQLVCALHVGNLEADGLMHHRGESRDERAAAMLRKQGYQARALDGGYPRWKEQGFPVEESLVK